MILGSCRGHLRRAHAPAVESNEVRVMALRQSLEDPRHLMTVKEVTTLWFKCQPKLLDIWYVSQLLAVCLLWFWISILALRFCEWTRRSSTMQCEKFTTRMCRAGTHLYY